MGNGRKELCPHELTLFFEFHNSCNVSAHSHNLGALVDQRSVYLDVALWITCFEDALMF